MYSPRPLRAARLNSLPVGCKRSRCNEPAPSRPTPGRLSHNINKRGATVNTCLLRPEISDRSPPNPLAHQSGSTDGPKISTVPSRPAARSSPRRLVLDRPSDHAHHRLRAQCPNRALQPNVLPLGGRHVGAKYHLVWCVSITPSQRCQHAAGCGNQPGPTTPRRACSWEGLSASFCHRCGFSIPDCPRGSLLDLGGRLV